LRAAANSWTTVASGLRSAIDSSNSQIGSLGTSWQGEAKAAFEQEWNKLATAVRSSCDDLTSMATTLNQTADQIEAAQRKYAEVVGAAVVAGIAVAATFITFGVSDVVAAGDIMVGAADAVALAGEAGGTATTLFSAAADVAAEITARLVVAFGADLTAQAVLGAIIFPDHDPFGHLDLRAAAAAAVGLAAPEVEFDGLLAGLAAKGAIGAGSDALSQEVGSGKINPVEVLFSGLQASALGAVAVVGGGKVFSRLASQADEAGEADGAAAARSADDATGLEPADPQLTGAGDPLPHAIPEDLRPQNPAGDYTRPSGLAGGQPAGTVTQIGRNAGPTETRAITNENESARTVAADGYDVVQNPTTLQVKAAADQADDGLVNWQQKRPDLLIENRVFDVYAPEVTTGASQVAGHVAGKVFVGQTQRVLVDLRGWNGNVAELERYLAESPVPGLREVKLILPDKSIVTWSASLGGWTY
jgi:WXG100 family type VII secretion target